MPILVQGEAARHHQAHVVTGEIGLRGSVPGHVVGDELHAAAVCIEHLATTRHEGGGAVGGRAQCIGQADVGAVDVKRQALRVQLPGIHPPWRKGPSPASRPHSHGIGMSMRRR